MKKAVVNLSLPDTIWSHPESLITDIREVFGEAWDVLCVPVKPGQPRSDTVALAAQSADGAEVYFGWGIPGAVIDAASGSLRWAHTAATGVGSSVTSDFVASGAILTNSRGIHNEPMADWVLTALGYCARGFHQAAVARREQMWAYEKLTRADTPIRELVDLRVGIVGFGGIGQAVARRCAALGIEVRAIRRHPDKPTPKDVVWIGGKDEIIDLAMNSNALVLALPYTNETKAIVSDDVLRALPNGSYVLNVSRGALLDHAALRENLDNGHLGGCVLDVVEKEPLLSDHWLWKHPKVFLTPHVSAVTPRFWERELSLLEENIGRYVRGDRLKNIVNLEAGY